MNIITHSAKRESSSPGRLIFTVDVLCESVLEGLTILNCPGWYRSSITLDVFDGDGGGRVVS